MQVDSVIWDVAGTTVEDRGQGLNAFTAAVDEYNLAISAEGPTRIRGRLEAGGAATAPAPTLGYCRYRKERGDLRGIPGVLWRALSHGGIRSISGAGDTFEWLRARGVRVALTADLGGVRIRSLPTQLSPEVEWQLNLQNLARETGGHCVEVR